MAGAAFSWTEGLSLAVASNISDVMAPLEELFTVEYTGKGEDGIKVPTSPGGLTMTTGTKGTIGASDSSYAFGGVSIVPTPRFVSVPVAEEDLENATDSQVQDLILALTEALHQEIILDIQAAMAARLTTAPYQVTSYTAMEEAAIRAGKWTVKKNKAPGDVRLLITSKAMQELEADLVSKNLNALITERLTAGMSPNGATSLVQYGQTLIYPDVYLGDDGASPALGYNLAATKRGVWIAYGGIGPRIKVLPTEDPINVRLTMKVYLKVDIPNPKLACWIQTQN